MLRPLCTGKNYLPRSVTTMLQMTFPQEHTSKLTPLYINVDSTETRSFHMLTICVYFLFKAEARTGGPVGSFSLWQLHTGWPGPRAHLLLSAQLSKERPGEWPPPPQHLSSVLLTGPHTRNSSTEKSCWLLRADSARPPTKHLKYFNSGLRPVP